LRARPIKRHVEDAPVQTGTRVLVVGPGDETFDRAFLGKEGDVVYLEFDCGCGQTYPSDPMIGVEFANGKIEEFWFAELRVLGQSRRPTTAQRWSTILRQSRHRTRKSLPGPVFRGSPFPITAAEPLNR
jgi:hypothetical protein